LLAARRLDVANFPRAALGDKQRPHIGSLQSAANRLRHKLWPVVTAEVLWRATTDCKEVLQNNCLLYYVWGRKGTRHLDRQALASGLVDHCQVPQWTNIFGAIRQKKSYDQT